MCIEVQAQHIHAAGVFVGKDYSRPVLTAVCVKREGDTVKVQATDSYRLISIESKAEEDGPDETILIPYKEVKAALPKKGLVTLCLNHQTGMLSITSIGGSSTTVKAAEGSFPDADKLIKVPKGDIDGTAVFGLNCRFVGDAGKAYAIATGCKADMDNLRLTFAGGLNPIMFDNFMNDGVLVHGIIATVRID